jgi:hypothetical protein
MPKPKTIITDSHINIILRGIEHGYTIQECCIRFLGFSHQAVFYHNATKDQKALIVAHKLLHSNQHACYSRIQKRLK